MGVIPKEKINQLPISLVTSKDNLVVDVANGKGDAVEIFINRTTFLKLSVMIRPNRPVS
ncbi:MAG: hypothetical protein WKF36_09090 [Candidatus Nitrosocosmicus sp.]